MPGASNGDESLRTRCRVKQFLGEFKWYHLVSIAVTLQQRAVISFDFRLGVQPVSHKDMRERPGQLTSRNIWQRSKGARQHKAPRAIL